MTRKKNLVSVLCLVQVCIRASAPWTNTTRRLKGKRRAGSVAGNCAHAPLRPNDERPNVLLVLLDDSGFGDVGFNWNATRNSDTPFIDSLAVAGLSFTNFYAAAPICT